MLICVYYKVEQNQKVNLFLSVLVLWPLDAFYFGQISYWSLEWHPDTEWLGRQADELNLSSRARDCKYSATSRVGHALALLTRQQDLVRNWSLTAGEYFLNFRLWSGEISLRRRNLRRLIFSKVRRIRLFHPARQGEDHNAMLWQIY